MKVIIAIDFGMTASAAECFSLPGIEPRLSKHHKFGKVPTLLQFDFGNERSTVWGSACSGKDIRRCFKAWYPNDFADSQSQTSIYISDYLERYCAHILQQVTREEGTDLQRLQPQWNLTTPGCWSEEVRRSFKMLAWTAISRLLPNPEVVVEVSEAVASSEFLINHLQLQEGTWAITCDVGGATIDIAFTTVQKECGNLMPKAYAIANGRHQYSGVCTIDDQVFGTNLKLTGFQQQKWLEIRPEILRSLDWQQGRHCFDGTKDVVFDLGRELGFEYDGVKFSIHGSKITVPKEQMEQAFEVFLGRLYEMLNEAIRVLKENLKRGSMPGRIALCGGGGTMVYMLKKLKIYYSDLEVESPSSTQESALATISGHSIYLTREAMKKYWDKVWIGVSGGPVKESVRWNDELENFHRFRFSSRNQIATHYLMVIKKECSSKRPKSVDDFKKNQSEWSGTMVVPFDVTLGTGGSWLKERRYFIEVGCSGFETFLFNAYDSMARKLDLSVGKRWDNAVLEK